MQSKLPLLPSGPGGVRKSAFHGPWQNCSAKLNRGFSSPQEFSGWKLPLCFGDESTISAATPTTRRQDGCKGQSYSVEQLQPWKLKSSAPAGPVTNSTSSRSTV